MLEPKPPRKRLPPSSRRTQAEAPSRIRLLVADSHDITLAGTCTVVSRIPHITVVARATTAAEALAVADRHVIDLAILEHRFSDGQGIDVCRRIRSAYPDTQILMLTDMINEEDVFSALRAGVAGILFKSVGEAGLLRAIEAVCCGQMIFDRRIVHPLVTHFCSLPFQTSGEARPQLSHQEQRVMALVADGKTNKEIAATLGLTNKTVKNRLSMLYEKLQVTRRTQATKMFIEQARKTAPTGWAEFGSSLLPHELP